jgi:glycosyltransferase involved in cell wall biosynthesis
MTTFSTTQTETPLRLALMSSQKSWGGGEQFLWNLGNGLIERGHEVLWIAPRASKLVERVRAGNGDIYPMSGRRPTPLAMLRLRRRIADKKCQVLHLNDSHATTWGSLLTLGKNELVRVGVKHTVFPVRTPSKYNWFVDRLMCVSEAVRKTCIDGGILAQKLQVIYGGLEQPNMDRADQRYFVAEQLKISIDRPILVSVGSLIPCKGHSRLIDAIDRLRKTIPNICLAICGDGILRDSLLADIKRRGLKDNVRLVGFQHEPQRWIAGADLFVHPSQSEGLSLVAIQSQMIGTPVVAMDVGGLSEVMRSRSGKPLGWLSHPNKPDEFVANIADALENTPLRRQRTQMAKIEAADRFSIDGMIDQYESSYYEMANGTRQRTAGKLNTHRAIAKRVG